MRNFFENFVATIRSEIEKRIGIPGKYRGYLLAPAHILQADVSTDTVVEMIKASVESGRY